MASTRTTTATKPASAALLALGLVLAGFAVVNLFWSFTPAADLNALIGDQLKLAAGLPQDQEIALLKKLKTEQEMSLAARPSEPGAWLNLSLLRAMTGDDRKEAFAALQTSDLVSPYEGLVLPQRALAWRNFRAVQTSQQKDYQDTLWQRAFALNGPGTWDIAKQKNITGEVRDALVRKDASLAKAWQGLMFENHITN